MHRVMRVKPQSDHRWDLEPREAMALQRELAQRLELRDRLGAIRRVAGIDVGFPRGRHRGRAVVAVLDYPSLEPIEHAVAEQTVRFPYVPGLLSFREVPVILAALGRLDCRPDVLLCDGQGYAHPRRLGIACHLGLLCDTPSIGVAKTRLIGTYAEPDTRKGAWSPLVDAGETVGAVLRTRTDVKPVFVSTGHRVGLETAVRLVLRCTTRYRLPETTRRAHALASG